MESLKRDVQRAVDRIFANVYFVSVNVCICSCVYFQEISHLIVYTNKSQSTHTAVCFYLREPELFARANKNTFN